MSAAHPKSGRRSLTGRVEPPGALHIPVLPVLPTSGGHLSERLPRARPHVHICSFTPTTVWGLGGYLVLMVRKLRFREAGSHRQEVEKCLAPNFAASLRPPLGPTRDSSCSQSEGLCARDRTGSGSQPSQNTMHVQEGSSGRGAFLGLASPGPSPQPCAGGPTEALPELEHPQPTRGGAGRGGRCP